jgi:hypothetical protein
MQNSVIDEISSVSMVKLGKRQEKKVSKIRSRIFRISEIRQEPDTYSEKEY